MFSQFTYDGVEHHGAIDNVDLRYANHLDIGTQNLLYGFTLHNNPMMQDIYNTGATWGFPYASSPVALTPNALRLGTDRSSAAALNGYNPYWRFALQREWEGGRHSAMIGTYGLVECANRAVAAMIGATRSKTCRASISALQRSRTASFEHNIRHSRIGRPWTKK